MPSAFFDFLAADDLANRFHRALAAGALERVAAPNLEDEVAPEGAHVAGGLFRRGGDEEGLAQVAKEFVGRGEVFGGNAVEAAVRGEE
jgi:hypothetical protein